jgi:hypothetical protein
MVGTLRHDVPARKPGGTNAWKRETRRRALRRAVSGTYSAARRPYFHG